MGMYPQLEIIEEVDDGRWHEREQYWIEHLRSEGAQLLNIATWKSPGPGFNRYISDSTREKLRRAFKGRPISPEQRALISKSLTGKKQSPETVAKRRETILAKYGTQGCFGDTHRKAVSEGLKGRVISPETREKLRQTNLGKKQSAETIAKRMQSEHFKAVSGTSIKYRRAKGGSPEHRAKISEALKKNLASLTPEQREQRMAAAKAKNWRNNPAA